MKTHEIPKYYSNRTSLFALDLLFYKSALVLLYSGAAIVLFFKETESDIYDNHFLPIFLRNQCTCDPGPQKQS